MESPESRHADDQGWEMKKYRITGNQSGHHFNIGDVVHHVKKHAWSGSDNWYSTDGKDANTWCVLFVDREEVIGVFSQIRKRIVALIRRFHK